MKKLFVSLACIAISVSAYATPGNNGNGNGGCGVGQQTNGCGNPGTDPTTPSYGGNATANAGAVAGAVGVGVGVGVGMGGEGGRATSNSNAQGGAANAQGGAGGNSTATGGSGGAGGSAAGGSGTGGAASAVGSVTFEGSTYKEAAQTAYAPDGKAPRTSCRLFVGFGGSSVNGSLSGGIPIGNDQTCVSGAMIEAMDKANKVQAGTFGIDDYLLAICAIEGMDKTKRCTK